MKTETETEFQDDGRKITKETIETDKGRLNSVSVQDIHEAAGLTVHPIVPSGSLTRHQVLPDSQGQSQPPGQPSLRPGIVCTHGEFTRSHIFQGSHQVQRDL